MKLYLIGEVSKTLEISVQAIRLYQRNGLIKPTKVDDKTGYRYYCEDDIGMIWRIKILQSAGFKLSEIKELDDYMLDDIEKLLRLKRDELAETISKKTLALKYLNRKIDAVRILHEPQDITIKEIDDRYGKAFNMDINGSIFDHYNELAGIKGTYGLNQEVAYLPSRRLTVGKDEIVLKDLFAIHFEKGDELSLQKGGRYICLKVKGKGKVLDCYEKLFAYAKENGYTLRGDAIEVLLINNNLVIHSDFNLREIQVAVS